MSAKTRLFSRLLTTTGIANWSLRRLQNGEAPTLTILAYHRVAERDAAGDPQVISATPAEFAWQMDYLCRGFTVLAFEEILQRVQKGQALPANAAIITFDDGYADILEIAAPILRQRGLPATIFLTTGMIGTTARFWWDELYTLLQLTPPVTIDLPRLGSLALETSEQRRQAMKRLRQQMKALPETERSAQMAALRGALGAGAQISRTKAENTRSLCLNWEETRQLRDQGFSLGSHTHTHPILTRLPLAQAEAEIATSKRILEAELERPARLFAYPNGEPDDFDGQTRALLIRYGFEAAVTLVRGGNPLRSEIDWLALRRIHIGGGDDRNTFIVKTSGLPDYFSRGKAAGA